MNRSIQMDLRRELDEKLRKCVNAKKLFATKSVQNPFTFTHTYTYTHPPLPEIPAIRATRVVIIYCIISLRHVFIYELLDLSQ